jgi:MFS family permease
MLHERPVPGDVAELPSLPRASPRALGAIYLVVFGLAFGWAGAITTLAPLYGGQVLGLGAAAIGRTLAAGYVAEAILLVPVGWAADTVGRLPVLLPGLAVLLVGIVLLPLTAGPATYAVTCVLLIVGMTVWMIPASLLAEHLHGRLGGRAVGAYRLVVDLGMVVAPALVGWLTERGGFGVGAGAVALVVGVSGGVAGFTLGRRGRRAARHRI